MTVYSERFVGPQAMTAVAGSIHTVPAGRRHIIMSLLAAVGTVGSPAVMTFFLNGTGTANRLLRVPITDNTQVVYQELRLVLEAGDVLYQAGNPAVTITLSGYDLEVT